MNLYQSSEDYLERILMISKQKQYVHAIDIVHSMGFSKPSVSIALKKLKEKGLIRISKLQHITLTPEGLKIAKKILERHEILKEHLTSLGVDPKVAEEDACAIEHEISDESFDKIKALVIKNRETQKEE